MKHEHADKDFEDYLKFFDIVEGMPVAKQMVINKKTGVIKPKYDKHYVPMETKS